MKAYVILDGGGIKGAALAGCLSALEGLNVEVAGYGGCSAGSIVGLLGSIGYNGDELLEIMAEFDFSHFFDDDGTLLEELESLGNILQEDCGRFKKCAKFLWQCNRKKELIRVLTEKLGLYKAHKLENFIRTKIHEKFPNLKDNPQIQFKDLINNGAKPLRIVASDVTFKKPVVFPNDYGQYGQLIIEAIRASAGYPFVFRPIRSNKSRLVDGGLSSNLPIFLFGREREANKLPLIAFDLVSPDCGEKGDNYGFQAYINDLIGTSLEAGDLILRDKTPGIYYVPIRLDSYIPTLGLGIDKEKKTALFNCGKVQTYDYFSKIKPLMEAKDEVEEMQALKGPPKIFRPVLRSIVRDLEKLTDGSNIRCSVMLPTDRETQLVVYQYNMENDDDKDMELSLESGCSGYCWRQKKRTFAFLSERHDDWGMTPEEWRKVPSTQKAMMSFPIWDLSMALTEAKTMDDMVLVGTLNLDTATEFDNNGWANIVETCGQKKLFPNKTVLKIVERWADVLGKMLS